VKLGMSFLFVDFAKAFDRINRKKLCELRRQVGRNKGLITSHCVELIISVLDGQIIEIFEVNIEVEKGVMQGSPLSPKFVNFVVESVLKKSKLLRKMCE